MHTRQADQGLDGLAVLAKGDGNAPAIGQRAEDVLDIVGGADWTSCQFQNFAVVTHAASVSVAGFQDIAHHNAAIGVCRHGRPKRRVIDNSAAA